MIHWSPSPEIFSAGPITVRWYGLCFLIGFWLSLWGMQKICEKEKLPAEKMDTLLLYVFIGTLVGARLGHCLLYEPAYYLSKPHEILKVWQGGLASHGGALGVIFMLWLFSRKHAEFTFMWLMDRCAVFTVMTGGFIRFGNLMNSEIFGRPTDLPWAFVFEKVDQIPRHPTQIYESLIYFSIFAIGIWAYQRYYPRKIPGLLFGLVYALMGVSRFFVELLKENQVPFENALPLNMGQMLSVPFVMISGYLAYRSMKSGALAEKRR